MPTPSSISRSSFESVEFSPWTHPFISRREIGGFSLQFSFPIFEN
jgi:hypothetical protein